MLILNFASDEGRFPIYFHTLSCSHEQEDVHRPRGLEQVHQIMVVKDGSGTLECDDGKKYKLRKGSAFFLRKGYPHSYIGDGNLTTIYLTYKGRGVGMLHDSYENPDYVFYENVDADKYLNRINEIFNAYSGDKNDGRLSSMVYSFVVEFFEEKNTKNLHPMENVLHYMETNFGKKITLDELAKLSARSRSQFCKEFKNYFNCTAFEKLMEIRLSYAYTLTSCHGVSTKDAAAKCGFEDVGYFCRAFKKRYGTSPQKTDSLNMTNL